MRWPNMQSRGEGAITRGLEDRLQGFPHAALDRRLRGPAVVGALRRDAVLMDEHERHLLEHRERFVAVLVILPVEDPRAGARRALVDAIEHDVPLIRRPALVLDLDAVDEEDALEIGLA